MQQTFFPGNKAGITAGIFLLCITVGTCFMTFKGKKKNEIFRWNKEINRMKEKNELINQYEIQGKNEAI